MAQHRDMAFHLSSPPSDGGADSYRYQDTPDTRTTFSPLDSNSSQSSRLFHSLDVSAGKVDDQPDKFDGSSNTIHRVASVDSLTSAIHDKDPFITSTPEKQQQAQNHTHAQAQNQNQNQSQSQSQNQTKLSATASAFHPFSVTPIVANGASNGLATPKPLGRPRDVTIAQSPNTGLRIYTNVPLSPAFSHDLKLSRSMRITSTSGVVAHDAVREFFTNVQALAGQFQNYPEIFPCRGATYVRCSNIRDAMTVLSHTGTKPMGWRVEAIPAQEVNKGTGINVLATENEGLHNLIVYPIARLSESQIQDEIREHFKHYDIFAMAKQPTSFVDDTLRWVMEWSDVTGTWACAVHLYNRGWVDVGGLFLIMLAPYSPGGQPMHMTNLSNYRGPDLAAPTPAVPDLATSFENMSLYGSQQTRQPLGTPIMSSGGFSSPAQVPKWPSPWSFGAQSPQVVPSIYQSLLPRGITPALSNASYSPMSPVNSTFSTMGSFSPSMSSSLTFSRTSFPSPRFQRSSDARRQNASRVNRAHFSPPGPHHNHVDINKIREGTDVRTTIMLRNIPNKVDQAMLKDIVDESSWGKYDFMYLRIDFANDCNVGYAFINFVDPLDIIDFVNARGNQRWNCFKSDKIAEISYATIQGKDCLVQKFRNSSVMLEAAHYRPKLYYTSNGPTPQMAGQEEPFPEPDNQSKMKRSCENAEHVGLFTPNAGQHFRDEQRRRRSQYDRGTRLAALEECGDYGMYPNQETIH